MKKFLYVFTLCMFLSPLFASGDDGNEKSIYFCTKDIDALQSIAAENKDNDGFKNLIVYKKLNNELHAFLRHCFFVFAKKISDNNDGTLTLKVMETYGYGSDNFDTASKGGRAYPEADVEKKVVSCVPIIKNTDLTTESGDIYDKWAGVLRAMDKETDNPYNTFGHNCCTVAYGVVKNIKGNLEQIDPSTFNLYGVGIIWGQTLGYITDLTSSSSSGSSIKANKTHFVSDSEEEKKEEL